MLKILSSIFYLWIINAFLVPSLPQRIILQKSVGVFGYFFIYLTFLYCPT